MDIPVSVLSLLSIVGYVIGSVVGLFLVLAPLFIWHHVAKLRHDLQDEMSELRKDLFVHVQELRAVNANFEAMQQRYIKTMQYVCDRLADICDHLGVEEHKTEEPTAAS
jgi:hypothetical protein